MLKPNAHQATPVRVLGTVGPDGSTAGAGASGGFDALSGSLSGGNGALDIWVTQH
jgi:hypothetical protein